MVRDPCGIVCFIFTYLAVFYADYVVTRHIILLTFQDSIWGSINVVVFNTIVFLLAMSHLKAVFLDPGTVPLPTNRLDFSDLHANEKSTLKRNEWTLCTRCETFRPPRAHHCRICKRCIRRMDHHCPWICNCVGERNQKYFLQFLIYVGMLSVYSIILVVYSWVTPADDIPTLDAQARMLHSVVLLLESGLFGLFVVAIMVDQLHAILCDETAIEAVQMKGTYRPNRPKLSLMAEVCGNRNHPLCWIFPCTNLSNRNYDVPLLDHDV